MSVDYDPGGIYAEADRMLAAEIHAEKYDDPHAGLHAVLVERGVITEPVEIDREKAAEDATDRHFLWLVAQGRELPPARRGGEDRAAAFRDLTPEDAARRLAALHGDADAEADDGAQLDLAEAA